MNKKYAFVSCSSSNKISNENYFSSARDIALSLSKNNYNLVFGACNNGLMGEIYKTMKQKKCSVIGVTHSLYEKEFEYLSCDEEYTFDTINKRLNKMIDKSDVLIFLPGGTGTLEELTITIEKKRRKEINKQIIIFDEIGFYRPFIEFLQNMENEKFSDNATKLFNYVTNIKDFENILKN